MAVPTSLTVPQMIELFLIEYDRIVAQVSQSYTDDEIVSFLNRAQEQIIAELYAARRFDLLGSLYVMDGFVIPTDATPLGISNGFYVSKSDVAFTRGVMFFTNVIVNSVREELPAGAGYMNCEWIDSMLAKNFMLTPSNSYILFREPKIYVDGNYLIILVDSFTSSVPGSYIQYIRYPLTMIHTGPAVTDTTTLTCDLPASVHKDVVTKAVELAKEATDRLQKPQQQTQ